MSGEGMIFIFVREANLGSPPTRPAVLSLSICHLLRPGRRAVLFWVKTESRSSEISREATGKKGQVTMFCTAKKILRD
jgi:hypothetical protein